VGRPPNRHAEALTELSVRASWHRLTVSRRDILWHEGRRCLIERAVRGLRVPDSGLVLDVAGGDGHYSAPVTDRTGGRLVVSDISASAAAAAAAAGRTAVRADARALPYATGVADIVVAFECISYFKRDEVPGFVAELHRVLRPGGVLLLSTPNRYSLEAWKGLLKYVVDGTVWDAGGRGHVRLYSRGALRATLAAEFTVERVLGYYLVPAVRRWATPWTYVITENPLLSRLCHKLLVVARRR
jgi:SAM-dependent methyltransferase